MCFYQNNGSTLEKKNVRKIKSLKDRKKIPISLYLTVGLIVSLQCFSGMWKLETLESWIASVQASYKSIMNGMTYLSQISKELLTRELNDKRDWMEYGKVIVTVCLLCLLITVLFIGPFRAGMWTGKKATKHVVHRYMGLIFLIQYGLAWVEYLTNYENGNKTSFLPHTIALNGVIQGISAFFSFKVLPELDDNGFYSDKAVLSRNFVHENIFYSLLVVGGSVFYNESLLPNLRSSALGQALIVLFTFFPYIALRPFFPTTRFKDTGRTKNGRSAENAKFYEIVTVSAKIFYLWGKYFLAFFMNFMVFLDLLTEDNWKLVRGLFLMNSGTVSISVFLHTLRFKKVLPPKLSISIFLLQIYATFSAIPYAYDMFSSHYKLCLLTLSGILCNMTRSQKMHAAWCVASFLLIKFSDIQW